MGAAEALLETDKVCKRTSADKQLRQLTESLTSSPSFGSLLQPLSICLRCSRMRLVHMFLESTEKTSIDKLLMATPTPHLADTSFYSLPTSRCLALPI
jgi:hypothetical protein